MKVGFTGTRKGMTDKQDDEFCRIIIDLWPTEFHHGCCVGADEEAHELAQEFTEAMIVCHPPDDTSLMATLKARPGDKEMKPYPYLTRNRHIVKNTEVLIATPRTRHQLSRGSGTWWTIRYARSLKRPIIIIYPDGQVRSENKALEQSLDS